MKVIVAGLGIQGNKRRKYAGKDYVASVDPVSNEADYRCISEVPLNTYDTVIACDSYTWNDSIYTQSGTYSYSGDTTIDNNYSMNFNGNGDLCQYKNLYQLFIVLILRNL